jgi:hypothetical protein
MAGIAAGSLTVLAIAPAMAEAAVRVPLPKIGWSADSYCAAGWVEVKKNTSSVSAQMFNYCTDRANVRVELFGPGYSNHIDGYMQANQWGTQTMYATFKPGSWTACASYRNRDWSLVGGTRQCATESYK